MRVIRYLTIWLLLSTVGICVPNANNSVHAQAPVTEATYTVVFTSTWSNETHPHEAFPASAHYSPLIGATHTVTSSLWLSGTLASAGIEQMAETGGTSLLRSEITALGDAALETITGSGLGSATGQVTVPTITVDSSRPAVTLVTMIAPSPDWFVGVHGLSLLDEAGMWQDEVVVTLYPYDAGTDDGIDYTSANAEPATHQPIHELRGTFPFSTEPMGTLTFTRQVQHTLYLPVIQHGE